MNSSDQTAEFIYLITILVFVLSAFFVRKVPIGRSLQIAAAWIAIFLAGFVIFSLKDDIASLAGKVMDEHRAEQTGVRSGEQLRVKQSLDGHFWVTGELNGRETRFLVDSGATVTSISSETARRAGIEPSHGFPVLVQTANGSVTVQRGRAERLKIGHIQRDNVAVHISDGFGETNVLGMNFLSSLSGWAVEGQWLVLNP